MQDNTDDTNTAQTLHSPELPMDAASNSKGTGFGSYLIRSIVGIVLTFFIELISNLLVEAVYWQALICCSNEYPFGIFFDRTKALKITFFLVFGIMVSLSILYSTIRGRGHRSWGQSFKLAVIAHFISTVCILFMQISYCGRHWMFWHFV